MDVENEEAVRTRLAKDPWGQELFTIRSVEPWSMWLQGPANPRSAPNL
jgi:hypothetical protein